MKKWNLALTCMALLLAMTACSGEANEDIPADGDTTETTGTVISDNDWLNIEPFDYMANDLSGYIKLGEYKGLTVTKESDTVTDEEFDSELALLLENYSYYEEYTDRAVEEGDDVRVDYSGYRDGVQFEGGTAVDATLTAAPDTGYIEGFAEAFIGKMPGEEFSFDVTFPEDYGNTDLAGVEVTFKCTVHAILGDELIVPELTDEFVNETFGYANVDEFKIAYRTSVEENKKSTAESNMYASLWLQVVDNAEVTAYPEEEVNRIYGQQNSMYQQYAAQFGTDYETFLSSYLNMTDEDLLADSRVYVKEDLVMYQLVKDLGVEITDEEYAEGLAEFAEAYGMTEEELIAYYTEETVYTTILWQKLMSVIAAESNIVIE